MKISYLLKYLADLNPQNSPARLAFYNFFRHFHFENEDLTAQVLNTFFSHTLEYPHWVSNKNILGKEVQMLVEGFVRVHKSDFDFSRVLFPQNLQLVEIQSFNDLIALSHSYARTITSTDDKYRVIADQGRRIILVTLRVDLSVDVTVFDKKFVIRNGQLEPLRIDLKLSYDSHLNLKENTLHLMEIAPYLLAQFEVRDGRPQGRLLRGYVFQKYQELNGLYLEEQMRLFLPLKRLEQIFIDKQSDPYYLNLIGQLSEAPSNIRPGDLSSEKLGRRVLERAELAFQEIFIGDKTLASLIHDLRQILQPTPPKDSGIWLNHRSQGLTK